MKFDELKIGQWFNKDKNISYMKIADIEDKWGNLIVAVSENGELTDSEEIKDYDEVNLMDNPGYLRYCEFLSKLPLEEQRKTVLQFLYDMMDWTEQSPAEELYTMLATTLVKND